MLTVCLRRLRYVGGYLPILPDLFLNKILFSGVQPQAPRPDQNKPKQKPPHLPVSSSRYNELLRVIEELGKDVKPTYAGSKNAGERLRKGAKHIKIVYVFM